MTCEIALHRVAGAEAGRRGQMKKKGTWHRGCGQHLRRPFGYRKEQG